MVRIIAFVTIFLSNLITVFRDSRGNAHPAGPYAPSSQLSLGTSPMPTNMQLPFSQLSGNAPPRSFKPFDVTTQAWIWDDLLWLPDVS